MKLRQEVNYGKQKEYEGQIMESESLNKIQDKVQGKTDSQPFDYSEYRVNKPRLMVTGASELIGSRLISNLSDKKDQILALYEKEKPREAAAVLPVYSNYQNVELLTSQLKTVRAIVHTAWNYENPSFDEKNQVSKNLSIMKVIIKSAENAGSKRIIFVSSVGASKHSKNEVLRERYLAETLLLNSKIPEKIIVRTPLVFADKGFEDSFFKGMMSVLKVPFFYPVIFPDNQITPLHVDDAVSPLVKLIDRKMIESCAVIEVRPTHPLSVSELHKLVWARYGSHKKIQIKGRLGNLIFDKLTKKSPSFQRYFKEKCEISPNFDGSIMINNPYQDLLPKYYKSIQTVLSPIAALNKSDDKTTDSLQSKAKNRQVVHTTV